MAYSIQKGSFWKRISAWMFDMVISISLTLVFLLAFIAIFNYNQSAGQLKGLWDGYAIQTGLAGWTDEMIKANEAAYNALEQQTLELFFNNATVIDLFQHLITIVLIAVSISILLAYLVVYFFVPMIFKNGQTLGKKCFGLAVMRTNSVKVTTPVFLIRTVVGLFVIETLFPLMLLALTVAGMLGAIGVITPILLLILECAVMIITPTNSSIHDLLCDTVVVDMNSQEIFETDEEMLEYVKQLAAEEAAEAEYQ